MKLLYVDEAGCPGKLIEGRRDIQPAFAITGISVDAESVSPLTHGWIATKQRYFPNLVPTNAKRWDWHTAEVKGSDVRRSLRSSRRNERRHAVGLLDRVFDLLLSNRCQIVARVYLKPPGGPFNGNSVYTSAVQLLCEEFNKQLAPLAERGIVIADSRQPRDNSRVSHSVFTMKYRAQGDAFPDLVEPPVFGHSENHTGLQLTDLICSAVLFPICCFHFLYGQFPNQHIHGRYQAVADRFVPRVIELLAQSPVGGKSPSMKIHNPVTYVGLDRLIARHGSSMGQEPTPSTTPPTPPANPPTPSPQ